MPYIPCRRLMVLHTTAGIIDSQRHSSEARQIIAYEDEYGGKRITSSVRTMSELFIAAHTVCNAIFLLNVGSPPTSNQDVMRFARFCLPVLLLIPEGRFVGVRAALLLERQRGQ